MGKNTWEKQIREVSKSCAPDMTHFLGSAGNGNMGDGMVALWNAAERQGVMKGIFVTGSFFVLGIGAKCLYSYCAKNRAAVCAALSQGQQSGPACVKGKGEKATVPDEKGTADLEEIQENQL